MRVCSSARCGGRRRQACRTSPMPRLRGRYECSVSAPPLRHRESRHCSQRLAHGRSRSRRVWHSLSLEGNETTVTALAFRRTKHHLCARSGTFVHQVHRSNRCRPGAPVASAALPGRLAPPICASNASPAAHVQPHSITNIPTAHTRCKLPHPMAACRGRWVARLYSGCVHRWVVRVIKAVQKTRAGAAPPWVIVECAGDRCEPVAPLRPPGIPPVTAAGRRPRPRRPVPRPTCARKGLEREAMPCIRAYVRSG